MLPDAADSQQTSATPRSAQCELHVWPTRAYNAVFHGAMPTYAGPGAFTLTMYLSPMDRVRAEMRGALDPDIQSRLIKATIPNENSPLAGYRIILHEAPEKTRFANFIDKHVGDGPREVDSESSCYAELHLVGLTTYRTAVYAQLQTIYVFRNFGSSKEAVKVVRDAARTAPPKNGNKNNAEAANAMLQASFADAIAKISAIGNLVSDSRSPTMSAFHPSPDMRHRHRIGFLHHCNAQDLAVPSVMQNL
ncbi:hypothetical protein [Sphingomonas sp. CARO-RG-8B-R24-01]|uniref:hypothetical protein n=1 Tax=Sphingomonas sp. CARO-RG-8B-R24-01 TaxID=2914831 RepID=UPI001F58246C|nr:hypothetical protein [Sphingomonas sp. CARO-RG-8B-R24-01]